MWKIFSCLVFVATLGWGSWAAAQDCCGHCGCHDCVRKVCVWKEDIKKVPVTTYDRKTEDFCMPGISQKGNLVCTTDCNGCERCKLERIPTCGKVYTRTKLVKNTEIKEVKTYKWTVEYVCDRCARCAMAESAATEQAMHAQSQANSPKELAPPQLFSLPLVSSRRGPPPSTPVPPPVVAAPPDSFAPTASR